MTYTDDEKKRKTEIQVSTRTNLKDKRLAHLVLLLAQFEHVLIAFGLERIVPAHWVALRIRVRETHLAQTCPAEGLVEVGVGAAQKGLHFGPQQ